MQKREGFRVEVTRVTDSKWVPAPRESAVLVSNDFKQYMFGGLNFDAQNDLYEARIIDGSIVWSKLDYKA